MDASYGYDEENRLYGIVRSEAEAVYLYTNGFVAGHTLALTNGNVFGRFVERDPYRQELSVTVSNLFNGVFMQGAGYGHDLLGRRENRMDTAPGFTVTKTFCYNPRSEVTNAVLGADVHAYGYDPIGNRVFHAVNAVTNTYTANCLNQYTGYSYDADGNLLSDGERSFSWDAENRLSSITPVNATNGSLKGGCNVLSVNSNKGPVVPCGIRGLEKRRVKAILLCCKKTKKGRTSHDPRTERYRHGGGFATGI